MSTTTQYMIRAFQEQFPSLFQWAPTNDGKRIAWRTQPLVDETRVRQMQALRINKALLELRPRYEGATGSLVSIDDDQAVFLLRLDQTVIGEVRQDYECHHNEAHREHEHRIGETVGEAIVRLGCAAELGFVLVRHTGYEVRDRYSVDGYDVDLYKLPKDWSVLEHCSRRVAEANRKLGMQLDAIGKADDVRGIVELVLKALAVAYGGYSQFGPP